MVLARPQQIFGGNVFHPVELLPLKVSDYFSLVTGLVLAFGLCFQLPVVLSLAGLAGLPDAARDPGQGTAPYAIVGIVFVAAIVTPPDPLSQIMLAVPIYLLYEISIWCVRLMEVRRARPTRAAAMTTTDLTAPRPFVKIGGGWPPLRRALRGAAPSLPAALLLHARRQGYP